MATTNNLQITLIEQSQSQKEVTANEAFTRLEILQNNAALERGIVSPPLSPSEGDIYLLGSGTINEWLGHDGEIAYFNQIWRFITPREGCVIYVKSENALYRYDSAFWIKADSKQVQDLSADYTLGFADVNKIFRCYSGINVNLQDDSTVFYPTGSEIEFIQYDTNSINIIASGAVNILSESGATTTNAQYTKVKLTKLEANTWLLS